MTGMIDSLRVCFRVLEHLGNGIVPDFREVGAPPFLELFDRILVIFAGASSE
jgi:hypothetical protein